MASWESPNVPLVWRSIPTARVVGGRGVLSGGTEAALVGEVAVAGGLICSAETALHGSGLFGGDGEMGFPGDRLDLELAGDQDVT